jgi:hypothetical protein
MNAKILLIAPLACAWGCGLEFNQSVTPAAIEIAVGATGEVTVAWEGRQGNEPAYVRGELSMAPEGVAQVVSPPAEPWKWALAGGERPEETETKLTIRCLEVKSATLTVEASVFFSKDDAPSGLNRKDTVAVNCVAQSSSADGGGGDAGGNGGTLSDHFLLADSEAGIVPCSAGGCSAPIAVPSTPGFGFLLAVTRGSSFLAVGGKFSGFNSGMAFYSADGLSWTDRSPSDTLAPRSLGRVAFGGGRYVAVGESGIFHTTNGTDWAAATGGPSFSSSVKVAWGNDGGGKFVLSTGHRSVDGQTFTAATTPPTKAAGGGVAFGSGRWVALGLGSSPSQLYAYFSDDGGDTWAAGTAPGGIFQDITHAAHAAGRFVATGMQGTILYSDDGATWLSATVTGASHNLRGVAHHPTAGFMIAGGAQVFISANGIDWTAVPGDFTGRNFQGITATE